MQDWFYFGPVPSIPSNRQKNSQQQQAQAYVNISQKARACAGPWALARITGRPGRRRRSRPLDRLQGLAAVVPVGVELILGGVLGRLRGRANVGDRQGRAAAQLSFVARWGIEHQVHLPEAVLAVGGAAILVLVDGRDCASRTMVASLARASQSQRSRGGAAQHRRAAWRSAECEAAQNLRWSGCGSTRLPAVPARSCTSASRLARIRRPGRSPRRHRERRGCHPGRC